MDLTTVETLMSGIAIGGFFSTILVMVANGRATRVMWVGVAFFLCASAHVFDVGVTQHFDQLGDRGWIWHTQNLTTSLFWAFLLGVFDDTKGRFWPRLAPVAFLAVMNWLNRGETMTLGSAYWAFYHALSVAMMIHLLVVMIRGKDGDLVEVRRRLRLPLVGIAACYISFVAWLDFTDRQCCNGFNNWQLIQLAILAFMALGSTIAFLQAGPIFWGTRLLTPLNEPLPREEASDGVERTLIQRVQNALTQDQIWKREGLTIGVFAHELAIPEYRLRRLINERLGYRNFADFINSHRIDAAKAVLSDPAQATLSISQLAFDLGFASLGPFNRAFKADTNLSPSEWRSQKLADS
jgi:AraC-like DNA-binding protein